MRALLGILLSTTVVAGVAVLGLGAESVGLPRWFSDTAVLLGCVAASLGIVAILDANSAGRDRRSGSGPRGYARGRDGS